MLAYAETLLGIPYRWWNPEVSCCDTTGPFWASVGGEVPLESIKVGHLNCAGLLNVICRKFDIYIPGAAERHFLAGGTGLWWEMFEEMGVLIPYEEGKAYPKGTILLRKYKAIDDQGHIAIVYDEKRIIHCWPEGGVILDEPAPDYYEMVVLGYLP